MESMAYEDKIEFRTLRLLRRLEIAGSGRQGVDNAHSSLQTDTLTASAGFERHVFNPMVGSSQETEAYKMRDYCKAYL